MAANFVHPVTPAIIVELELNDYMFGLALAAMMAFNFLFSPLWGKVAGFLSSKKVILVSGIGYAIGQLFFGIARTEIQFLLARMFAGIFVGGCYVAFLTYTVNCSSEETRGRNLAINATLSSVSGAFGYFVGGMVGEINIFYPVWLQAFVLASMALLLFLGSLVLVRYLVLNNHSYLHCFFTHRALVTLVFSLLASVWLNISLPQKKRRQK
jgi:DHA1 family multidrug resistance protein-like MFS transporter